MVLYKSILLQCATLCIVNHITFRTPAVRFTAIEMTVNKWARLTEEECDVIIGIILSLFGASCLASIVVFSACVASARADQIQREAFSSLFDESEQLLAEKRKKVVSNTQLALNP